MVEAARGRVIVLNGASSSGKTSIGRALQARLPDPWFLVPVDAISALRSTSHTRALDAAQVDDVLARTRRGYHRAIAGLASAGNDVIMDYPLSEPWRLDDLLEVLDGYDVTLVDVRCSVAELERRESARQDRPAGLAVSQSVFDHGDRDIEVDTSAASAEECADQIVRRLGELGRFGDQRAFGRLRRPRSR